MSEPSSVLPASNLPELDLHCPTTLDDAFTGLANGAHPLAGGTDVLLWASQRGEPRQLVWTGAIPELHTIEANVDNFRVGAAVPIPRRDRRGAINRFRSNSQSGDTDGECLHRLAGR